MNPGALRNVNLMKTLGVPKDNEQLLRSFRLTTLSIKIICVILAGGVLSISSYGFVFYSAAMLPGVVAHFGDKSTERYSSATVCAFNLLGLLPYLTDIWSNTTTNDTIRDTIGDVRTWITIYGAAMMGQLAYWLIQYLTVKLYIAKSELHATFVSAERDRLCTDWGIKADDPYRGILEEERMR